MLVIIWYVDNCLITAHQDMNDKDVYTCTATLCIIRQIPTYCASIIMILSTLPTVAVENAVSLLNQACWAGARLVS